MRTTKSLGGAVLRGNSGRRGKAGGAGGGWLAQRCRCLVGLQLDPCQTQPEGPRPTRQLLQQSSRQAAGSAGDITCHMTHKRLLVCFKTHLRADWVNCLQHTLSKFPCSAAVFSLNCHFSDSTLYIHIFHFIFLCGHLAGGHMHQLGIAHARRQVNMLSNGSW